MVFTGLMTRETLENAFIVGLLLTGSMEQTETAILDSIQCSCPDDPSAEKKLFRRVIHFAIDAEVNASNKGQDECMRASSVLPSELNCVLALSRDLRHCFVLRILVALPREVCAWLLHLDISQVNQRTQTAMLELAEIHKLGLQSSRSDSMPGSPSRKSVHRPKEPFLIRALSVATS
jgi:hypothetical protein